MSGWLVRLNVNQRLALVAVVLGAIAVFADPMHGGAVTVDAKELALMVSKSADEVAPSDLADWIVAGRSDYRLVDLRDASAYAAYHIPGADNIPIAVLPDSGLLANERIVLYADDSVRAAQGWFLLRAKGFRGAYILRGGLDGWKSDVLFPRVTANATADQSRDDQKRLALAAHFGGAPRDGDGRVETAAPALPKIEAPAAGAGTAPKPGVKKKKEGC